MSAPRVPGSSNSDYEALVERVAALERYIASQNGPVVSSLPTTPYDGQKIYYQNAVMLAQGVMWAFRYNAANPLTSKWESIGSAPLTSGPAGGNSGFTSTVVVDMTGGPSITVPLTGVFTIKLEGFVQQTATALAQENLVLGRNSVNQGGMAFIGQANFDGSSLSRSIPLALTAGDILTAMMANNSATPASYSGGFIELLPIHVGP